MTTAQHSGQLYLPDDPGIMAAQDAALELQYDYNHTRPSEKAKRAALLQQMFAKIGPDCYIEPPLHANWAGKFVTMGTGVYANFNLTLVDDTTIHIGDYVLFGPNVVIATGTHPVAPELRAQAYQYNLPVTIGNNVWFGAGAIVLPGITIGDNTVVGAGSVVTHDLPANVVAVGNPAKVLREIGPRDRAEYAKGRQIDPTLFQQ